ncbi:MAG: type IV pilus assembly protein PilM [Actinomycetota bacterium]|nr:type IV pilus assembly protein PilM [Actinomycetota bacterium]
MDDQSLWKKELSFGRKPKEQKDADDVSATDEKPASVWKKELSLKRKAKADADAETPAEEAAVEAPVAEKPVVDEPVAEEPVVEEPVAAEPKAAEETVWKKEVSFSRKPETEQVAEQPPADEHLADEPVEEVEPVAIEEPVAEVEPVAEDASAADEPVAVEPRAAEAHVTVEAEDASEPWNAAPAMPPAPAPEAATARVPVPIPSVEVHPPVPQAELPPIAEAAAKVPFWKKELSLGGKKRDKPVKERKEEATAAQDTVASAASVPVPEDAAKVPFWKKELSLGGKKGDKPVKERKQKAPKVKADGAAKTREPKQPQERKQKAPKVKAERGSSKGRIVGLKIGASQLAAARVSNNGSAELLQVAREPLAPGIVVGGELRDPDALAEALKDFFAKHGLPKKGVRLGIANNRIGVRTFEIAGVEDEKQLANAIRFRAQETLPIPIDQAVLDYQILGAGVGEDGQPTKRVLLVVAYRELIDRYVDACKKAGITLVGIDLEAFALLRALQAPQEGVGADASAALVVVAIGHERSTFAVSDGRVCEFTRVLEWGGSALNVAIARAVDAAPSEVEGAKRALALTDEMVPDGLTADQAKKAREAMRRAIQTFARELVSSLQYYQNQPGSLGIGEIVLTGGTAHLPGLPGELERLIGVHVRVGDPLARMKVSKKVGQPEQIGSLAVAIGLGIDD